MGTPPLLAVKRPEHVRTGYALPSGAGYRIIIDEVRAMGVVPTEYAEIAAFTLTPSPDSMKILLSSTVNSDTP